MNIHGVFYVKDASLVEKQKQVAEPEVPPNAMEMDSVPTEVQLPDVDKMADKTSGNAVPDGEVAAGEEMPNDDPAQAEEEMERSTTDGSGVSVEGEGNGNNNGVKDEKV